MDSDLANASPESKLNETELGSREFLEKILDVLEEGVTIHSADGQVLLANRKALEIAEGAKVRLDTEPESHQIEGHSVVHPLMNREGAVIGSVRVIAPHSSADLLWNDSLCTEYLATLGHMIAGLAHDLGTPLNIISGYAEYLLLKNRSAEGQKELKAIIDQTRRIAEYVKQVVELARPSSPRLEALDPQIFFKNLSDLLGSHLRKAGVEMTVSCPGKFPLFYGDEAKLNQAFFSILLKGARAVGAGGRLELIIADGPESADEFSVILKGRKQLGEVVDLSTFGRDIMAFATEKESKELELSLARKILNELGARVLPLDLGEQGMALAVYLKRSRG
jgi:signal transduction histidine kinase